MNEIFTKQIILEDIGLLGQQKISKTKLAIVGCGGLGTTASLYAARSGFCQLDIYDDDVVEISNLSRQILFDKADVAKAKVDVAKQRLEAWADIGAVQTKITESNVNMLEKSDIILDCSDNLETSFLLDKYTKKFDKKLIFCGVDRWSAQLGILGADSPNLCDIIQKNANVGCELGVLSPTLGIMGAMMINELIKYLMMPEHSLFNQLIFLDFKKNITKTLKVGKLITTNKKKIDEVESITEDVLLVDIKGNNEIVGSISLKTLYQDIKSYEDFAGNIVMFCDNVEVSQKTARGLGELIRGAKISVIRKENIISKNTQA